MFYPAYINLQDRKCLVVGGGTVAERKVVAMLLSGGDVTLISPDATELLTFLAHIGTIRWHKRQLKAGDTRGYFLVCAATDFTDINSAVFTEAHEKNKIRLVNVVDVIPQCTFAAASVVTDGELMLSISTSGKSPATSRRIREYFEKLLDATSLYTLGYEAGKPVPIENQGLPYPVYLLLENRLCVVLSEQKTPQVERRISLLNQCGASIVRMAPNEMTKESNPIKPSHGEMCIEKPHYFEDAFLVIADKSSAADTPRGGEGTYIQEHLDKPDAGTHFTPHLIVDNNLIISIAVRSSAGTEKAERLYKKLTNQFESNGYGAFIEFLGARRSEILKSFPTSKKRADFFENLIDYVKMDRQQSQMCCLGLTDPGCSAECLFNWVRRGKLERANDFVSDLLRKLRTNPS